MIDVAATAQAIYDARTHHSLIPPPRHTFGLDTLTDAYAAQELNTRRWQSEGRKASGRKIGLTSTAVQAQLGVDEPDFGMLWADLAFAPGDTLPSNAFVQAKAEAEIAVVLDKDLNDESLSAHQLLSAIAYLLPAVEVVDSAVANWDIKLVDTVADNASSGGYVLGDAPRMTSQVDLRTCGMLLSRNHALASQGVGAACLGHPLNSVLWLARKMAVLGQPLRAGDLILSGALGPMVTVAPGDHYFVEIQGFAPFSFSFSS